MRFSYTPKQESSAKKTILLVASIILLISISQTVQANRAILVTGDIYGDCVDPNANISLLVYRTGNPLDIVDTQWTLINMTNKDYSIQSAVLVNDTYDFNISVSNPSCSPSAYEEMIDTNIVIAYTLFPDTPLLYLDTHLNMSTIFSGTIPANGASTTNQTQFNWTNDYLQADTYTLEIATANTFGGSIVHTQAGIPGGTLGYKLSALQELADSTYYWRVHVLNTTPTIFDTSAIMTFDVLSGEASISNPSPSTNSWVLSNPNFSVDTDTNAICRWDLAGAAFESKTVFSITGGTTHTTTLDLSTSNGGVEGANTIYVSCNATGSGVVNSADFTHVLRRDTTAPTVSSVNIDAGALWSTDTTLDFTWSGSDGTGSGITTYYYSTTNNQGTTLGTADASSPGTLSGITSQGSNTIYVWATDAVGNIGTADSDSIGVDTMPPNFNGGGSHTSITKYSAGVSLRVDQYITDTSGLAGPPNIRYRMENYSWSAWIPMLVINPTNFYYNIPEGAGTGETWFEHSGEMVYYEVNVTDAVGWSNNISRSEFINNASTPPTIDAVSDIISAEDQTINIVLSGSDADFDQLTFTCNNSDAIITRIDNEQSNFIWATSNDDVGLTRVYCNVSDGVFVVTGNTFTINITNVNDNPVLEAIGNLYAQEYEFFNYTFNASDPDGDTIRYYSNNSILPLNRLSGKTAFTPFSTQRGEYDINISVSDGNGGFDYEEITFTIGYCGDNVCTDAYENCEICAVDCGICGETESKAIVLNEPRNCFGRDVLMQAVKLVERATCEEEGAIINNMEVCGELTSTSLQIVLQVDTDAWEEVAQVITDEVGYASFGPQEKGKYKAVFLNDRDIFTEFQVEECTNVRLDRDETGTATPSQPSTSTPTTPPIIEEPTIVNELENKWTFFSLIIYFLIIPIIFIAIITSGMGFVYRLEKSKKHENAYVKQVDKWIADYQRDKKKLRIWMEKTTPFKELLVYWDQMMKSLKKYWRFTKDILVEAWTKFILAIGLKKNIKIPYLAQKKKASKKHLLLVALLKNVFPHKNTDVLLDKVKPYNIVSLYDLAALLISHGIKLQLIDTHASDIKYLNTLISKGMAFRSRSPTRVDIESALQNGKAVVAIVNELGTNNTIIQSTIVISGFDKYQFYYHNYDRQLKDVAVSKDQFMHSWKAAGFKGLILQ